VDQSHFKTNETEAKNEENKVAVYVERTVAKVNMSENTSFQLIENNKLTGKKESNISNTDFTLPFHISTSDSTNYYPITKDGNLSCFTVDGEKTAFAVKVLGWCANGVNESGYLIKNISNSSYSYYDNNGKTQTWTKWNGVDDQNNSLHRSYWAEDINYTDGTDGGKNTQSGLTFKKIMEGPIDKVATEYIYENTVDQEKAIYKGGEQHPNVTTMLVSAQIVPLDGKFDDGSSTSFTFTTNGSVVKSATTLYRYNGILYAKEESILNIEKNVLKDYYYATTNNSNTTYTKIDDAWLASNYTNTTVKAVVDGGKQYNGIYHALGTNVDIYTDEKGSGKTTINDVLKEKFSESNKIEYFKDGKCFYQVPIEHPVTTDKTTETGKIYGVVRNHSYVLTLNSISNIGAPDTGATDETIELIPGQDQYYYLGCTLNVLAWRQVKQTVQL